MARSKLKLAFIVNRSSRKSAFIKRKKGLMKKLNEITTLCDIQACAVISSPDSPVPEMWPSVEGVQEVTSRYMQVPEHEREKKMVDHTTYLQEKIAKEKAKLEKLRRENRASQLKQYMFDILEGNMNTNQFGPLDLQDLIFYTQSYINKLQARAEEFTTNGGESSSSFPPYLTTYGEPSSSSFPPYLIANGESSSSLPPLPVVAPSVVQHHVLADVTSVDDPLAVTDAAAVTLESSGQYYVPTGSYDQIQYQNLNQNQQQLFQYQVPMYSVDELQHGISGMSLNSDMSLLYPNLHSGQYPNQQEMFMDPLMGHPQQMGYVGEHASIPFMDGNNTNYYHQLPTVDLATTGHMPTATNSAFSPYFKNSF